MNQLSKARMEHIHQNEKNSDYVLTQISAIKEINNWVHYLADTSFSIRLYLYRVGEVMHFSIFYYLVYIIMLRYYILTTWPPPPRPRSNLIIDAIKNAPIIIVVYEKCGMCLRTICAICSLKQCSCYFSMRWRRRYCRCERDPVL